MRHKKALPQQMTPGVDAHYMTRLDLQAKAARQAVRGFNRRSRVTF
jgi:hypothetical protein